MGIFRREWATYLHNISDNWQEKSGLLTMPLKYLASPCIRLLTFSIEIGLVPGWRLQMPTMSIHISLVII